MFQFETKESLEESFNLVSKHSPDVIISASEIKQNLIPKTALPEIVRIFYLE